MSIKISNNIGFCVHEEFFKLLADSRELDAGNYYFKSCSVSNIDEAAEWRGEGGKKEPRQILECAFCAALGSHSAALNGSTKNSFLLSTLGGGER
jgi:hypothetical protein